MATINQLLTAVRRVGRGGSTVSKDEAWSESLIIYFINQHRAKSVYERAYTQSDAFSHIDPQLLQDVTGLQLANVDRSEIIQLPWGCTVKKIVGIMFNGILYPIPNGQFPKIVDLRDAPAISFFGNVDKRSNYFYTTSSQIKYKLATAFGASFGWFFMIGNNFYVVPPASESNLCFVSMQAVFLNPMEIFSLNTGYTLDQNDSSFFDIEYPITPTMISEIESLIVTNEFKAMLETPIAVSNASTSVQELIQEQKGIG